jgi:cyclic beta-1,2-glucan glucanotransferase
VTPAAAIDLTRGQPSVGDGRAGIRRFSSPNGVMPATHLLSNGSYSVMLTAAGSGYSHWRDIAVTRWREDGTTDNTGSYVFLRDVESHARWSAGFQPTRVAADSYDISFAEDAADFARRDDGIVTRMQVIIPPDDDAEIRIVSLENCSEHPRNIDVTSYAEIVLTQPAADAAHPAFSNLFIETEIVTELDTLLATRRSQKETDLDIWLAHVVAVEGIAIGKLQWETDRLKFLGRGRSASDPLAETGIHELSNTTGAVLDPIVSLRRRVLIPPGATARVAFTTIVAQSRHTIVDLAARYRDISHFDHLVAAAQTQTSDKLRHIGIEPGEPELFQTLGSAILYSNKAFRASESVLARQSEGVGGLWAHTISGDKPIVLAEISDASGAGMATQLVRAQEFWAMKCLDVDLVFLNDAASEVEQDLEKKLEALIPPASSSSSAADAKSRGQIVALRSSRLSAAQRDTFETAARVVLNSACGNLAQQAARAWSSEDAPVIKTRAAAPAQWETKWRTDHELEFHNGFGGFDASEGEYVIGPGKLTPAPWVNVIANPVFGCIVSESGAGCTWSVDSQQNLLTTWSNDPVGNPSSDAFYIRDEDSGELWSPTPLPVREQAADYTVRHGHGFTRFLHEAHGIGCDLVHFVPADDPIRISRLTLENHSGESRRVSVTAYLDWVLGVARSSSAPFVITEMDEKSGAMFARNTWSTDFSTRIAFADLCGGQTSWTADRTEFLGRNGNADRPFALSSGEPLSGRTGAGLDPCCALKTRVAIPAGEKISIVLLLGQAESRERARALLEQYRAASVDALLDAVKAEWTSVLGALQVETPDRALDLMLNQWLLYQTLSCRVWGRTAFYQASGAYGFRDQLQDVMALAVTRPDLTRAQILRAASRQFVEGDVQHWWHEPKGRGIRTRISDDMLWLPYVTAHYIDVTGDSAILDESIPFLTGPVLKDGQVDLYFEPGVAADKATLFEHCARAVDRCMGVGSHGLPLMGTGDWNDGMNRVGDKGKGESVWLAWFLNIVIGSLAPAAAARGDAARAEKWISHSRSIIDACDREAWDGHWYLRAWFDDGTPLGTMGSDACAIASLSQTWSVLSGAGNPDRARRAMESVEQKLVRTNDKLILLLTPPFDQTSLDPGYVKGYLPGVRENGGQYSHAAVWAIIAFAELGDGDKAGELIAMLNPVNHSKTLSDVERYFVEPYIAVGDVYSVAPHVGRGGWSWYTGTAGWLYRAGTEWLLGIQVRGTRLTIDPCIPSGWPGFRATIRYHSARYDITVQNPFHSCRGVAQIELDGCLVADPSGVLMVDDGMTHQVRTVMGEPSRAMTGMQ